MTQVVKLQDQAVTAFDDQERTLFRIPGDIETVITESNMSQRIAEGHHWRTAAMVYAWTYDEGRGRPQKMLRSEHLLNVAEYSKLGIRGLTSRNTVAKYRKAMQWAIENELCAEPEPDSAVMLPAVEFPKLSQPANYSSESNEWYTPQKYIEAVHECLGNIDLDPASCPLANQTIGAGQIFTEKDDGLSQEWFGNVFLNPPYGKEGNDSRAGIFCRKAIDEYTKQNIDACILLVNSVHSQEWQRPLWHWPVCLVDHRIQFVSGDGTENKNPTFQNAFFYLGPDVVRFKEVFSRFGYVVALV